MPPITIKPIDLGTVAAWQHQVGASAAWPSATSFASVEVAAEAPEAFGAETLAVWQHLAGASHDDVAATSCAPLG